MLVKYKDTSSPIFQKVLILSVVFQLLINDISFALSPEPGTQVPAVRREAELLDYIYRGRLIFAEKPDDEKFLRERNRADAVLLSHGKILAAKELKRDPLRLIRKIIHEEVEAVMQIMAVEDRGKYSALVNIVLSRGDIRKGYAGLFPAGAVPALPDELLANDIIAKAFELLIPKLDRLAAAGEFTTAESTFLLAIEPVIMANRHNYFTGMFWDRSLRETKIRAAMAGGISFRQAASAKASDIGGDGIDSARKRFISSKLTPDQFSIVDDNRNHAANNILKVLAEGRLPETFPYQIQLDLTRFCPKWELIQRTGIGPKDCLQCAFPEKSRHEVSHGRLVEILDNFETHGGRSVFITGGGEPGAYTHWHELFEFFAGSSLGITMNTNGHFVRRMAFEDAGILRRVFSAEKDPSIISVSIHDEEGYEAIKKLDGMRKQMGLNIVIRASFMIHSDTSKEEILAFIRQSQSAGVDMVAFKPTHILRGDELIFNPNQDAHDIIKRLTDAQANINAGRIDMGHGYDIFVQAMRLNRLKDSFEDVRGQFKKWNDNGSEPVCLGPLCNLYLNSFFQMGMCCDTKDTGIGGMPAEVFGDDLPSDPREYFIEAMWGMIKLNPHHCIVGCGFMEPNLTFPHRFGLTPLINELKSLRTEYRRGALTEEDAKRRIRALFKNAGSQSAANVKKEKAARAVDSAWNSVQGNIAHFDPAVAEKKEAFLSRFYNAMYRTVIRLREKAEQGTIDPLVNMKSLKFSDEDRSGLHEADREIRVGFLAIAGNPLNWGHILISFMGMNEWNLDTVIFRTQGEMSYKKLLASERVSAQDRHLMVREAIKGLYPLIRYSDLGSEEGNDMQGEEEAMRFLEMNPDKKIHLYFMIGAENEDRMWKCMRWQYDSLIKHGFGKNPGHKITFAVIQRGEYGAKATLEDMRRISRAIQDEKKSPVFLDVAFAKDQDIDLNVSSTYYRNTQDGAFVPDVVHELAKSKGYYGHPPIDPRTGRPVTASQEEYFRKRLEPVCAKIARQVEDSVRNGVPGSTALISIDGGSGSGKTTIAEEVSRFLKPGMDAVVIPLDIFLKDRRWRLAVQKLVTGRRLNAEEERLVGDVKNNIKPGQSYTGEEDFFDNQAILKMIREIDEFRRSGRDEMVITVREAYDQKTKTVGPRHFKIKKGTVVIFEGKYANEEMLQAHYDLRYRLHDDPDRTRARFEIRSRQLSPADADMQIIFYGMSLVPSYEAYDYRTAANIHSFIDLRGEDWFLGSGAELRKLEKAIKTAYGAAIFDVDGTLIDGVSGPAVSSAIAEKISGLANKGVYTVLASGRTGSRSDIELLYIDPDPSLRGIVERSVSSDLDGIVKQIMAGVHDDRRDRVLVLEQGGVPRSYSGGIGYADPGRFGLDIKKFDPAAIRAVTEDVTDRCKGILLFIKNKGYCVTIGLKPGRTSPEDKRLLEAASRAAFERHGVKANVVWGSDTILDVFCEGVEKYNAIRVLTSPGHGIGLDEAHIATIGDQGAPGANDNSMLERAGGFCVGRYASAESLQASVPSAKGLSGTAASLWLLDNLKFFTPPGIAGKSESPNISSRSAKAGQDRMITDIMKILGNDPAESYVPEKELRRWRWREEDIDVERLSRMSFAVREAYGEYFDWKVSGRPRKNKDDYEYNTEIEKYARMDGSTAPRIVLNFEKNGMISVWDGVHRSVAAILRKDKTIKAYVGTPAGRTGKLESPDIENAPGGLPRYSDISGMIEELDGVIDRIESKDSHGPASLDYLEEARSALSSIAAAVADIGADRQFRMAALKVMERISLFKGIVEDSVDDADMREILLQSAEEMSGEIISAARDRDIDLEEEFEEYVQKQERREAGKIAKKARADLSKSASAVSVDAAIDAKLTELEKKSEALAALAGKDPEAFKAEWSAFRLEWISFIGKYPMNKDAAIKTKFGPRRDSITARLSAAQAAHTGRRTEGPVVSSEKTGGHVIRFAETGEEKGFREAADIIKDMPEGSVILVAGASCSGKTTFTDTIDEIIGSGKILHLELDNYCKDHKDVPRTPDGKLDFDSPGALDIELIRAHIKTLLEGKPIERPCFDFASGKRTKEVKTMNLVKGQKLAVEGILALHPRIAGAIADAQKFSVFIISSPQLTIRSDGPLLSYDSRLIRRIVRDARSRGIPAIDTIRQWPAVRSGEDAHIIPMGAFADLVIDTYLPYESSALKPYLMPLLEEARRVAERDQDADSIVTIARLSEMVKDAPELDGAATIWDRSVLREFIGPPASSEKGSEVIDLRKLRSSGAPAPQEAKDENMRIRAEAIAAEFDGKKYNGRHPEGYLWTLPRRDPEEAVRLRRRVQDAVNGIKREHAIGTDAVLAEKFGLPRIDMYTDGRETPSRPFVRRLAEISRREFGPLWTGKKLEAILLTEPSLSRRLEAAREYMGLTRAEVEETLRERYGYEISERAIYDIERERRTGSPRPSYVYALSAVSGVSPDLLWFGRSLRDELESTPLEREHITKMRLCMGLIVPEAASAFGLHSPQVLYGIENGSTHHVPPGLKSALRSEVFDTDGVHAKKAVIEKMQPGGLSDKYDNRPVAAGLLHEIYVRNDMRIKDLVNPESRPFRVLYGGAGADISNVFLSTDATEAVFVADYSMLSSEDFRKLEDFQFLKEGSRQIIDGETEGSKYTEKFGIGHAMNISLIRPEQKIAAIAYELDAIGASNIKVDNGKDGAVRLTFDWAYYSKEGKPRTIIFVDRDITNGEGYPYYLDGKFDAYYQRAGQMIPSSYTGEKSFIKDLAGIVNDGGFFITDDHTHDHDKGYDEPDKFTDMSRAFPINAVEIPVPGAEEYEKAVVELVGAPDVPGSPEFRYGRYMRVRQKAPAGKASAPDLETAPGGEAPSTLDLNGMSLPVKMRPVVPASALKVCGVQLPENSFARNTGIMEEAVSVMNGWGRWKPDIVLFPESMDDLYSINVDAGKREAILQAVSDRTGIAIGYFIESDRSAKELDGRNMTYNIIRPKEEPLVFRKFSNEREERVFDIGGRKAALVICVESESVISDRPDSPASKAISAADAILLVAGTDRADGAQWAKKLAAKYGKPAVFINFGGSRGLHRPPSYFVFAGDDVPSSRLELTNEDGVLFADVSGYIPAKKPGAKIYDDDTRDRWAAEEESGYYETTGTGAEEALSLQRIDISIPSGPGVTAEETAFTGTLKGLEAVSYEEFCAKASSADTATSSYEGSGQSLILYADDMLDNALIVDLENTIKNSLGMRNILTGGKIVVYARSPAKGDIVAGIIKRADPSIQVVRLSAGQLQAVDDVRETDAVIRAARAKGARGIFAVIRGPIRDPDSIEELSEFAGAFDGGAGLPIIITGPEKGVYSFAQAISMAIGARSYNGAMDPGRRGWVIILPPIRALTEELRVQYEEYLSSLSALVAA